MHTSAESKQEQKDKGQNDGSNAASPDAILDALSTEILKIKEKPYSTVEKKLADAAIRYGEILNGQFGGTWMWLERANNIVVSELGGKRVMTFPLKLIIRESVQSFRMHQPVLK